jgi:DNA-binding IclR family transcriptional regulator
VVGSNRTAAGRVLSILNVFEEGHSTLSLSEISRRADLTLSTTHRLVGELVNWGALERDSSGRYLIGLRLLELAALTPRGLGLRETALPFLDDLQHATRANVHLAVRDGHETVYVETLRARKAVHVLSRLGGRWPMHATGTGLVLLAYADPEVQEAVLAEPMIRYCDQTVVDPKKLRRILSDVRRDGIATAIDQITPNGLAIAAPIRGSNNEVVAAVSVVVDTKTDRRSVIPVLVATARGISRALGAPSSANRGRAGGPREPSRDGARSN